MMELYGFNVDLITAFGSNTSSAVQHFVQSGFARKETDSFDKWGYLASNTDLDDVFGSKVWKPLHIIC